MRKVIFFSIFIILLSYIYFISTTENVINLGNSYNDKGLTHLNSSEYSKAIIEFKNALKDTSSTFEQLSMYNRNIGLAFEALHYMDSAQYYKTKAISYCNTESYHYYELKGELFLYKNNIDSAIINLEKAIKLNPNKLEANNYIGLIFLGTYGIEYQNLKKALYHNKKANEIYDDSITKFVLGKTYYELEMYNEAEMIFKNILDEFGTDLDSKFALGLAYYKSGKIDKAKTIFEEVFLEDRTYISGMESIISELSINL
ncbi:tetratricopeptide repeat protein [Flammeovirga agarivorans]|uniref:Tetratricopeptide repeat protein n=1 Tax=Flammeovirga agarivorans TaxID=2726742 RepID=A0A7X8SK16_9BACT|nr:tetratricopeptide repeat protein [Flammeovirga agarivorans]NLR91680.1 tetratricopeptide repeat protein [Flammeovirga agarivorans]